MMYINTIIVRMQAIRSASAFELPAFSPNALDHNRHIILVHFDESVLACHMQCRIVYEANLKILKVRLLESRYGVFDYCRQ